MPSPVALATKEEEERRAWVTSHHEVVKLAKDCFGDRFSNNEIFDRLKISRRTGYRALGNDERIGKAPGRKPKILESTIKEMIDYIETGGCNDVGNVWKHLAEKFAPDCNPKTVQDAVKKSGFKNHRNTVKLEPLLNEPASEDQQGPEDEDPVQELQLVPQEPQQQQQPQQQQPQPIHQQPHHLQPPQHQNVIDPAFQQPSLVDLLPSAIQNAPDSAVRFTLFEICRTYHEAAQMGASILGAYNPFQTPGGPLAQLNQQHMLPSLQGVNGRADSAHGKRPRIAICRRCNQQYDRAENTMENRSCLYHKGSPQKIFAQGANNIEQSPEAYIWSCCGGNGIVRGCCRAMHTTKKKRKYGKKRSASEAGLDNDGDGDGDDSGVEDSHLNSNHNLNPNNDSAANGNPNNSISIGGNGALDHNDNNDHNNPATAGLQSQHHPVSLDDDPNIDASLQDLEPSAQLSMQHLSMQMAAQMVGTAPAAVMHGHGHTAHGHGHQHGHHMGIVEQQQQQQQQRQQQQQQQHHHHHHHLMHQHQQQQQQQHRAAAAAAAAGLEEALQEQVGQGLPLPLPLPQDMQLQIAAGLVGGSG